MKRVITLVNEITELKRIKSKSVTAKYLNEKRKEYEKINMNYFEEEFKPKKENGWVLLIDDNEKGAARYGDLFPKECFR